MPDYLYHYTSIETLALILQNKTIRFNSLDKMDDLQEQMTSDAKNIGKCVYISSWTDDAKESIPMWNMYSSLNAGVRIKLRTYPFKLRMVDFNALAQALPNHRIEISGPPIPMLIPYHEMIAKGFCVFPNKLEDLLQKVEYVKDIEKLCPSVVTNNNNRVQIAFDTLGRYKNSHWDFQNEWRYILRALPLNYNTPLNQLAFNTILTANSIVAGSYIQPFPYYDMTLDDNAFKEMEITMSPRISAGNRIILTTLVEKYNSTAAIQESSLTGLI